MLASKPHISIITPVLNAAGTIEETLESVGVQNLSGVEHLLIDACSSDGTLEIASRYSHLTVCTEADQGIYDGMNKGAEKANGTWLLFLQADDWLPKGTLEAFLDAISSNPSAQMISGGAEAVKKSEGKWVTVWSVTDPAFKKLSLENIALREPMINARLIRRDLFLQLGGFSLEYTLASDRDFLFRAAISEIGCLEIPSLTYRYRWHSGSSTMTEGNALSERLSTENLIIAKKYLSTLPEEERTALKQWHTVLTVQKAMNALEAFDIKELYRSASEGTKSDRSWMLSFLSEMIHSLPGFVARGGKTKSQILHGAKS